MRVRVARYYSDDCWYRRYIGRFFEVNEISSDGNFHQVTGFTAKFLYIHKDDFEKMDEVRDSNIDKILNED